MPRLRLKIDHTANLNAYATLNIIFRKYPTLFPYVNFSIQLIQNKCYIEYHFDYRFDRKDPADQLCLDVANPEFFTELDKIIKYCKSPWFVKLFLKNPAQKPELPEWTRV